jgi:hypothetical protein
MFRESADAETLKDIEKTYGKKTAMALDKYCKLFKKDLTNVVSDLKTDKNGMTEWDKFDRWAQRTMKVDFMDNFDDTTDWTGAEDDRKREQEFANADKEEERKATKKARRAAKRMLKKRQRDGHALDTFDQPKFGHFSESSGNDPQDVLDFIAEELYECEWVSNIDFDDTLSKCDVETEDGKTFVVSVDWDKM